MHLVQFYFENAHENGDGELYLERGGDEISKWTLLPAGQSNRELLRLIATACGGTSLFPRLPFAWQSLWQNPYKPLQVEYVLAHHPSDAYEQRHIGLQGSGIRTDGKGLVRSLRLEEYRFLSYIIPRHRARTGLGESWLFILGYGPEPKHHDGTDDFDFADPLFRVTRFHPLFVKHARLNDPVEFLGRVHYRGVRCKRLASTHVLERLSRLLQEHLDIDTSIWMELECDFRQQWLALAPWQRLAALPVIDAVRHLLTAYQKHSKPLNIPGLILFDRPDQICTEELFPLWARLMDLMFPETQFLITVADQARAAFPCELLARTCKLPTPPEQPQKPPVRAQHGAILLLDVDSRLPNLRYVVSNARFLILPWIKLPNLASRILGGIVRRLPRDWEDRYHYRPVLLETFVQLDRFTGTCYKAANWIRLGTTDGYSLYGKKQKKQVPSKAVFVYPLTRKFRDILCSGGA